MGIWQSLGEIAEQGAGAVTALFLWAGGVIGGIADPEIRRQVAFSAAMIALSAKMAKADGIVTSVEVASFRRLFAVPAGEEKHVARLFDIAKGDVAGFDTYAARVAAFYGDDREELEDVLDGLFVIATADGAVHRNEFAYLEEVVRSSASRASTSSGSRPAMSCRRRAIPISSSASSGQWTLPRSGGTTGSSSSRTILTS